MNGLSEPGVGLVGVCGVYCGFCPVFDVECPGCLEDPRSKECALYACASEKPVGCCFQCAEFPCRIHYEEGVYKKEALDSWKKMKRNR